MKQLLLTIILVVPVLTHAQSSADTDAVRQAALGYIDGWYAGDAERMERSLHPELVKRTARSSAEGSRLEQMDATWNHAVRGNETGLVGWFRLDEGQGTTARDRLDPDHTIALHWARPENWSAERAPLAEAD